MSVAGGERQRGGRRQQLGATLDFGRSGAGKIAFRGEQVQHGREPRRAIRLERRFIGFLGCGQQRARELALAKRRLHIGVGLPYLANRPELERGQRRRKTPTTVSTMSAGPRYTAPASAPAALHIRSLCRSRREARDRTCSRTVGWLR